MSRRIPGTQISKRAFPVLLALWLGVACFAYGPAYGMEPVICPDREKAAEGDFMEAYYLGRAYDKGYCGIFADKTTAVQWYDVAAEGGHMLAAYELGETWFTGDGVAVDYPKAKWWYLVAAAKGHGLSALRLGFLFAEGHFPGLTVDVAEAEKWFTLAAEQNAGDAQFRLGNFYNNYKQPRDYTKAFLWLKRAAEGGHRVSMYDLARLHQDGRGTPQDNVAALRWMVRAAEEDVLQAQQALADMYATGDGVEKNITEALKWTLRVAGKPSASAAWLNRAGDIFFEGWEGVPVNYPTALKFYERAAHKGDPHARARLARMYAEGLGVQKDAAKAAEYGEH